jgi:hypothetical protein
VEDLFCDTGDLPPILLPRRETEEGLQYLLPYFEGKIIDMDPSTSIIIVSVIKLLVQRLQGRKCWVRLVESRSCMCRVQLGWTTET